MRKPLTPEQIEALKKKYDLTGYEDEGTGTERLVSRVPRNPEGWKEQEKQ